MLMEKSMIELIPRSDSREPFGGRAPSQKNNLIAVRMVSFNGYSLLVLVDIIESCELWSRVRE